jgi:hypothetical protein
LIRYASFATRLLLNVKESVISSRSSVKASTKENWPTGFPSRGTPASAEPRKAVFEPQLSQQAIDIYEDGNDESETSSVVDSEEWIGEDDRASDSIAPSVMSEPEYRRHRILMQQPPRSSNSFII